MEHDDTNTVRGLLFEHHMIYQQKARRAVSQKEFADLIGIEDKLYNRIYNGKRKPSKSIVKLLAEYFDDLRFYDAANMERPDQYLFFTQRNWQEIPNGIKKQIANLVQENIGKKK